MAASSASAVVASRMAKLSKELARAPRTAVERAAFEAKKAIAQEIQRVSGGDNRLSGVGRSGAKVGVRYDVKGEQNATALVRATGPLHLVERPTKPHEIKPKGRGRGKRKKAVVTPAGARAKVQHPGTRNPPRPFEKGVKRAEPLVKREIARAVSGAFARGASR